MNALHDAAHGVVIDDEVVMRLMHAIRYNIDDRDYVSRRKILDMLRELNICDHSERGAAFKKLIAGGYFLEVSNPGFFQVGTRSKSLIETEKSADE